MDITKLHLLTTSLRDSTYSLESIDRKLELCEGKVCSGESTVIWETSIEGNNLNEFTYRINKVNSSHKQSDLYDMKNSWFSVEKRSNLDGVYQVLQLKVNVYRTSEENIHIRKVLLDKKSKLVTMCVDLEKQIKEITNV